VQKLETELGYPIYSAYGELDSNCIGPDCPPTGGNGGRIAMIVAAALGGLCLILVVALVLTRKRTVRAPIWAVDGWVGKIVSKRPTSADDGRAPSEDTTSTDMQQHTYVKRPKLMNGTALDVMYTPDTTHETAAAEHLSRYLNEQNPQTNDYGAYPYISGAMSTTATNQTSTHDPITGRTVTYVRGTGALVKLPHYGASDGQGGERLWTHAHYAAAGGDASGSSQVTTSVDTLPSVRGPDGQTPLHVAAYMPDAPIDKLFERGGGTMYVNSKTGVYKETALHMAVNYGRSAAVNTMLAAGADPNEVDTRGNAPLHKAVAINAIDIVHTLCRQPTTALDARNDDDLTPLALTCKLAHTRCYDVLNILLAHNASPCVADGEGRTPAHWAAINDRADLLTELLARGANKDAQDARDQTPLFVAAREGAMVAVKCLVAHGASKDITDQLDRLPRDAAHEAEHDEVVAFLDCTPSRADLQQHVPMSMHGKSSAEVSTASMSNGAKPTKARQPRKAAPAERKSKAAARKCVDSDSPTTSGTEAAAMVSANATKRSPIIVSGICACSIMNYMLRTICHMPSRHRRRRAAVA
jgi:ankyrin repeat protein